ncbi:MAG: PIG-L deacetylase family protein [Patescibacteria group bacterium]|jgi:LmbE family N-acetylglucosaminyl deacetylase
MPNTFLGKRILILTAHPDDESYAAAGSIYKNYQKGGQNFLICASFGENGKSHLKKPISKSHLKKMRLTELKKAGKILHMSKILVLGLPDGKIKKHIQKIYKQAVFLTKKIKPEAILSFGPDGISGHWDHIAIGQVSKKLSERLNLPLFTFAMSPTISKQANKFLTSRRKFGHYVENLKFQKPNLKIPINQSIKKRAIRQHLSQMDNQKTLTGFPAFAVKELLKAEYFISDR